MSYATREEIKTLFRDFADNADAAVDDTDLDLFLDNTTATINAKVGTLYSLPITEVSNPESFKILKQLQMYKVACIVDDILNDYAEADKKPMWCKKAHMLMEQIVPPINPKTCKQCEPTLKLPDADYTGTSTKTGRIKVSATSGAIFKKGANNW